MADELYRVEIKGWVVRKDYMEEPDNWDWSPELSTVRWNDFVTNPDIKIIKVDTIGEEENKVYGI